MHKLIPVFVLLALALASCEKFEDERKITPPHLAVHDHAARKLRPVILGKQKQNPFSLVNMRIAMDTLRNLVKKSDQQVIKPQSVNDIYLEATDLYVRFLPSDTAHLLRLIRDTTLIVYDFPLDYEIIQDGDYYRDTTVTNGITWYYSVVKPDYQPPAGIQYEVIEELFIPENSEYFGDDPNYLTSKSAKTAKKGIAKLDYNILKALYTISFTLTGNAKELQTANEINETADNDEQGSTQRHIANSKSNTLSLKNLDITKTSSSNIPSGYIRINTPVGAVGVKGVIVRMRRWFTTDEVRTSSNGYYCSNIKFSTILVGNSVGYYIHFDGKNGVNSWLLSRTLWGDVTLWTNTYSLGDHSPSGYTTTLPSSDDAWSRCVISNAIYDYCSIARWDGVAMPPTFLDIANRNTDNEKLLFPEMKMGSSEPNLMLYHKSGLSSYYGTVANTWHELIFTSLYNMLLFEIGEFWTNKYWNVAYGQLKDDWDNDLAGCSCVTTKQTVPDCSQQVVLYEAWAYYRKEELLRTHLKIDPTGHLTENPYLVQYIDAFKALRANGCQLGMLEKALSTKTIDYFKVNLLSIYPNLSESITSIPDPTRKSPNELTFLTYNMERKTNSAELTRVISCANPDVVALQEVIKEYNFEYIINKTGMDGEMLIIEEWTNYGIAMLWKPSLGNPKITTRILKRLTNSSDPEDRAYLIAEFSNFCFIATHYSLDQNDRNRMTDEIIAYAKAIGKPVYLGGDLNEWPHHEAIQKFKNNGFVILNDGTFTYPSSNPYKVLDMILGYKNSSTAHSFLSRGIPLFPRVDLRGSSDHLPYSITIELQ